MSPCWLGHPPYPSTGAVLLDEPCTWLRSLSE